MENVLVYIFVVMFFTNFVLCAGFLIAWISISRKTYVLIWATGFGLASVNIVINVFKDSFTSNELYWITVNMITLMVHVLAIAGFRQRSNLPVTSSLWLYIYVAVIFFLLVFFTVFSPHFGIRVSLLPFSAVLMCMASIYAIKSIDRKLRLTEISCIVMFCISLFIHLCTGIVALIQGEYQVDKYLELYLQINYVAMPSYNIGLGLFVILILADDLAAKMRSLAYSDPLTSLLNRRGIKKFFNKSLPSLHQKQGKVYVILADIDNFKQINDSFGHDSGDKAIISIADLFIQKTRSDELVCRLGGEEFLLVTVASDLNEAIVFTEGLRKNIEKMTVKYGADDITFTTSFGMVEYTRTYLDLFEAVNDADKLLYQAKNNGRNRVEFVLSE